MHHLGSGPGPGLQLHGKVGLYSWQLGHSWMSKVGNMGLPRMSVTEGPAAPEWGFVHEAHQGLDCLCLMPAHVHCYSAPNLPALISVFQASICATGAGASP